MYNKIKKFLKWITGAKALIPDGIMPSSDTPLHYAITMNKTETALALIKAGANIHAKGRYGSTPLDRAAFRGNTELVEALIKAGAEVR